MEFFLRIDYGLPQTSINSLLGGSNQNQTKKGVQSDSLQDTQDIQKPKAVKPLESSAESSQEAQKVSDKKERQTYGLMILELMSDEEYAAFERATIGMSEGEKMMAAQSLYSLTEFYQGQSSPSLSKNPYTKTNRAFGRYQDFIEQYRAIYNGAKEVNLLS